MNNFPYLLRNMSRLQPRIFITHHLAHRLLVLVSRLTQTLYWELPELSKWVFLAESSARMVLFNMRTIQCILSFLITTYAFMYIATIPQRPRFMLFAWRTVSSNYATRTRKRPDTPHTDDTMWPSCALAHLPAHANPRVVSLLSWTFLQEENLFFRSFMPRISLLVALCEFFYFFIFSRISRFAWFRFCFVERSFHKTKNQKVFGQFWVWARCVKTLHWAHKKISDLPSLTLSPHATTPHLHLLPHYTLPTHPATTSRNLQNTLPPSCTLHHTLTPFTRYVSALDKIVFWVPKYSSQSCVCTDWRHHT